MRLRTYDLTFFLGSIEVDDSVPVWNTDIEIYGSNITFKIDTGANKNQKWVPLRAMKTFIRTKMGHTT